MYYYEVAVASGRYHGRELLTYSYPEKLLPGLVVTVALQRRPCLGFIVAEVPEPAFTTKPIEKTHASAPLIPSATLELFLWMRNYYPAPLGITAQLFLPKDLPERVRPYTPPTIAPSSISIPDLTKEQQAAISTMHEPGSYLLHGETGSGKTRIYMEMIQKTLATGKSCIVLTPEISLTSQLAQSLSQVTNQNNLYVLHSQLTAAARRNVWLSIGNSSAPVVVVGPRSALFSPIASLGLIVLDEAHEPAYKQENAPHYHAARVAGRLASLHQAHLILGSATPSVVDHFYAEQMKRPIVRLTKPAITDKDTTNVHVTTVDMREKTNHSSVHPISTTLLEHIQVMLSEQKQTLLFLNRRGTARIVLCDSCGWQASCPHCDLPLTYHHDSHTLRCHTCSYRQQALVSCPACGNAEITLKSVGTKAIMTAMQKKFPAATIARFDADNLTGERVHEMYEQIKAGTIDILIGTQLLAKGLDLPNLGLVGILNADASLYIPDFSAQERTYQLLYQLIGRVGRGHQAGSVVIQTYSPDNPTIQAASRKDWNTFYEAELKERKEYLFPPYCYLLKLSIRRASHASAQKNAESVASMLQNTFKRIVIEGPAPAFHEKVQNKYVWQLIIKSKDRRHLLDVIDALPRDWHYDIDPVDLL